MWVFDISLEKVCIFWQNCKGVDKFGHDCMRFGLVRCALNIKPPRGKGASAFECQAIFFFPSPWGLQTDSTPVDGDPLSPWRSNWGHHKSRGLFTVKLGFVELENCPRQKQTCWCADTCVPHVWAWTYVLRRWKHCIPPLLFLSVGVRILLTAEPLQRASCKCKRCHFSSAGLKWQTSLCGEQPHNKLKPTSF